MIEWNETHLGIRDAMRRFIAAPPRFGICSLHHHPPANSSRRTQATRHDSQDLPTSNMGDGIHVEPSPDPAAHDNHAHPSMKHIANALRQEHYLLGLSLPASDNKNP
jgi:hypothetical protein